MTAQEYLLNFINENPKVELSTRLVSELMEKYAVLKTSASESELSSLVKEIHNSQLNKNIHVFNAPEGYFDGYHEAAKQSILIIQKLIRKKINII